MNDQTMHKIIIGDSRDMSELADDSIDLIITSPPYWQLKDYGGDNQIGYNDSYENYINHLNIVWRECYRALKGGSRLCVNIGDQFARAVYYGRYKVIPIRAEIIKFCEAMGFDYMGAIIWQKKTTSNTTGGASLMGSYPYPKNGVISIDYEFILIFKKLGAIINPSKTIKEQSKMTKAEWMEYFSGHWNFAGVKQDSHLAMFPEELPKRLIKMFSFVGDTVLDPFLGSGTTSLAAQKLNRCSVGYEINESFIPIIKRKLSALTLFKTNCEFIKAKKTKINYQKAISQLPYIFKDTHALDKKMDPKKMLFGSKIDLQSSPRQEKYFSVKKVISPELIKLNNELTVRLIGVKTKKQANGEAVEFLINKTKGQKVFLRFDHQKHDDDNNLFVYLYLKNKTFINAHLIKHGLAQVDDSVEFRYKNKFLNMLNN